MKKVFIISKYVGIKKLFLLKIKDGYHWTEECEQATAFDSMEEATRVFRLIPSDTIGNCFQLERFYKK